MGIHSYCTILPVTDVLLGEEAKRAKEAKQAKELGV
jgi:hypothetical protein